jgi:glyoxylase-like metal-dependent hydrolase (beta-lactamase superfamily II)
VTIRASCIPSTFFTLRWGLFWLWSASSLSASAVPQKAALQKDLADAQRLQQQNNEIKVTPPNVHYSTKMVLNRGGREIDMIFLGRGHTGGDTVVFLPKERIEQPASVIGPPFRSDA